MNITLTWVRVDHMDHGVKTRMAAYFLKDCRVVTGFMVIVKIQQNWPFWRCMWQGDDAGATAHLGILPDLCSMYFTGIHYHSINITIYEKCL